MTDPTNGSSNPAAEAEVLKAKTLPPMPAGSIQPIEGGKPGALNASTASAVLVTNPDAVKTALDAIAAAETAIRGAGNVTGDLSLALTGCATATKWLNAALAKANAAAPKA